MTGCDTTTTVQILDPTGTTVEPSGSRAIEDGLTQIPVGQAYVDILFSDPHEVYNFDELVVVNTTDNPPLALNVSVVSFQSADGFRAMFNASPDSAFYFLRWRITV